MMFAFKLSDLRDVLRAMPKDSYLVPTISNSLYSKFSFWIVSERLSSWAKCFPTSLLIRFLAKEREVRASAFLMIAIAPSLPSWFSAIFSTFSVSFCSRATPMHSPPLYPKSLSFRQRDSSVLFRIKREEMQTAPCIPSEFLRIELSTTPKSSCISVVLLIS